MNNNKGFSLIELMVVVAIIGILASIAVPNFQKFQRKARQSEAKTNLSALYMAEKAFHQEWSQFTGDFSMNGYAPEGNFTYSIGFAAKLADPGTYTGPSDNLPNTEGACADANFSCTSPAYAAAAAGNGCAAGANPTADDFVASATGDIGGAANDAWTIDNAKVLCNNVSGL